MFFAPKCILAHGRICTYTYIIDVGVWSEPGLKKRGSEILKQIHRQVIKMVLKKWLGGNVRKSHFLALVSTRKRFSFCESLVI